MDDWANGVAVFEGAIGGEGDEIAVLQAFDNLGASDTGRADFDRLPLDMVVVKEPDAGNAGFAVHCLLGNDQRVLDDAGPYLGIDVGSGYEVVVRVIDRHLNFADLAGPKGHDGNGFLFNDAVPRLAR